MDFFEEMEARIPKGEARTRFAPSPTGYMHVGNLRTALYTWPVSYTHLDVYKRQDARRRAPLKLSRGPARQSRSFPSPYKNQSDRAHRKAPLRPKHGRPDA